MPALDKERVCVSQKGEPGESVCVCGQAGIKSFTHRDMKTL